MTKTEAVVGQPTAAAILAGTVARPTIGTVADPFSSVGVACTKVMGVYECILFGP